MKQATAEQKAEIKIEDVLRLLEEQIKDKYNRCSSESYVSDEELEHAWQQYKIEHLISSANP